MKDFSAERIFFKVLHDCKKSNFRADPVKLHRAFYEMYLLNRDTMQAFDFIIRINPYSPKLEELMFYYQLCGILSRENPELINYKIKKDRLEVLNDENIDSINLKKPDSLIDIFG